MTINPPPASLPAEWIEYFRVLTPATIGRVVEEGFVDREIRPIFRRVAVLGTAVTLKLPEDDLALVRVAVDRLRPSDVLVIDQGGETRAACWDGPASLAAGVRGCVGVVVDGAVTDVVEIEEQGLPTFARAVSALSGRSLGTGGGGVNVAVQCGGVAVHPGDLVVADDNGVVVIPPQRLEEVGVQARAVVDRAPFQRAWLERGGALDDIWGEEAADIRRMLEERGWANPSS